MEPAEGVGELFTSTPTPIQADAVTRATVAPAEATPDEPESEEDDLYSLPEQTNPATDDARVPVQPSNAAAANDTPADVMAEEYDEQDDTDSHAAANGTLRPAQLDGTDEQHMISSDERENGDPVDQVNEETGPAVNIAPDPIQPVHVAPTIDTPTTASNGEGTTMTKMRVTICMQPPPRPVWLRKIEQR